MKGSAQTAQRYDNQFKQFFDAVSLQCFRCRQDWPRTCLASHAAVCGIPTAPHLYARDQVATEQGQWLVCMRACVSQSACSYSDSDARVAVLPPPQRIRNHRTGVFNNWFEGTRQ